MGRAVLITRVMAGVRRYQDLICWQLANELEKLVFELTETGPVSRDFKVSSRARTLPADCEVVAHRNPQQRRRRIQQGLFQRERQEQNAAALWSLGQSGHGAYSLSRDTDSTVAAAQGPTSNL